MVRLYRLKTQSGMVEKILWLLALGVDASALEEVFGVREITIRTWLCRSGMQGRKLHERFMVELDLIHVQLDELWANVKNSGPDLWLWVASDVKTKIVPVLQVGGRTQEMAYRVVHEPIDRKGKQQPRRHRRRTPAMAAGLTLRRWTVKELLSFPLP